MQLRFVLVFSLTLFVGLTYAAPAQPQKLKLSANVVTAGEELNVSCTASQSTTGRTLYIDGQPFNNRISAERLSVKSTGAITTWTINPVVPEDAGEYYCAVGSKSTDLDSLPQNVTVHFGPVFSHNGQEQVNDAVINITAVESSKITINCNVTGSNPMVSSLNLVSPRVDNVNFDNGTGTITIANVKACNEGNYTCTADNGVTTPSNISFVLMVTSPPFTSSFRPATSINLCLLAPERLSRPSVQNSGGTSG